MKDYTAMVDKHVGARIRIRRRELGFSQAELAGRIGVTFQQVQKYERGANRVSASMLYLISRVFEAAPGSFFQDLPITVTASPELDAASRFMADGGEVLADAFVRLRTAEARRLVIEMTACIADAQNGPRPTLPPVR